MKKSSFSLSWDKEQNNDLALKFLLFGVSPFLAFIYSLWRLNTKSSYLVFLLTGIFFGMALSVNYEDTLDAARHRIYFELDYFITKDEYYERIISYFSFDSSIKDIYRHTISFCISRFTSNYHWYFAGIAAIYGYFSLKSLRYFTSLKAFRFSFLMLILLYIFLKQDIFNINGVRFWTAGWLAIYCIFQIFVSNNKKYFFILLLTPLIHISFWLIPPLVILTIFYNNFFKLKGKDSILYIIYSFSFVFSLFSLSILNSISDYLPPVFNKLIGIYTDSEYMNEINDFERTLTGMYSRIGKQILINIMVVCFIFNRSFIINDRNIRELFYFLILMLSFVNIFMFIPSLGTRFFGFLFPFIAFLWLYMFMDKKYKLILFLIPFVFLRDIYVSYLGYYRVLDFSDLFSSPLYLIFKYIINYNL